MKDSRSVIKELISRISTDSWKSELEQASLSYHIIAAWIAIVFNPLFAITDYFNLPATWQHLLIVRLSISAISILMLVVRKRFNIPSYLIVATIFLLISLQNAYTYRLIDNDDLLGHNLNFIALLIGASMFLLWRWTYSICAVVIAAAATALCISLNARLDIYEFFVKGGLLVITAAIFMIVLIKTRYDLSVREIKARLALKASNEEIQAQAEEIKGINDNLEMLVKQRTAELEKKNKALEEYAFINAHKLRSPVASILGLVNIIKKTDLNDEVRNIVNHLEDSSEKLDAIVNTITKAIERGDDLY